MTTSRKPASKEDALPADALGQVHDADGLLVDEYSSDTFVDPEHIDALDGPRAHPSDAALEQLMNDGTGIDAFEVPSEDETMETIDSGARRDPTMDGEMGLGAEPHTPEELEQAAIGDALRGRRAVTRDGEAHGEFLMDSPDGPPPE